MTDNILIILVIGVIFFIVINWLIIHMLNIEDVPIPHEQRERKK